MSQTVDRRGFLRKSVAASAGAVLGLSFEEQALLAQAEKKTPDIVREGPSKDMPKGKIGNVEISRLICGGNLISAIAHSRDLMYVSSLLKHYFTDEKVFETFKLCEANGINTAIVRLDENTLRIFNKYWHQENGNLQWIAQIKPIGSDDYATEIQKAMDNGAVGIYLHGGNGDDLVRAGRVDQIGKIVERIKANGVIAGVAGHTIEVPMACEKAGINPDFYMKTFNSKNYWSAGPQKQFDSVWDETPERTRDFMRQVEKPWIAYKVLGAGAIHPSEGFKYAFENGADFLCVGMFDFQVVEDVAIVKNLLASKPERARPWRG